MSLLIIFNCLFINAFADGDSGYADELGIGSLYDYAPDETKDITGKLVTDGSYDHRGALNRLFNKTASAIEEAVRASVSQFTEILSLAVICALGVSFDHNGKSGRYISIIASCACILISMDPLTGVISSMENAVDNVKMYSNIALPSLFVASAAGGNIISGPAKFAAVSLSMDVITTAAANICKPLINAYLALGVSGQISDNELITNMTKFAKWAAITVMSVLMIAFTAYISLVGVISSTADAAAVKAAKTVISTSLPVVGGIISDAAAAVLSSASLIKASAGVFTLIASASICVIPFISCTVKMLIFKAVSAISDGLGIQKLAGTLNCIGTAIGLYCALLGSCGIMLFISISSALKVFTG